VVELAKALRWQVLMGAARLDYARCLRALVAGQLTNALLPLRAGDVVSVGLVKAEGGPLLAGTAALAAIKALDTLCLAGLAAAFLGTALLRQTRLGLGLLAAVLICGLALALLQGRGLRWRQGFTSMCSAFVHGLLELAVGMRNWRVLVSLVVTSGAVWTAGLAANWLVLLATGIRPSLDLVVRLLLAGYIVGLLPAPPVRAGMFEAGIAAVLNPAGVSLTQSLTAGVILHIAQLAELALLLLVSLAVAKRGRAAVVFAAG